jgi:hypothetical protein
MKHPHTVPATVINLFFAIGLVSAFCFRALIVFQHLYPAGVRVVWYVGTVGYFTFFMYRYYIAAKRRRSVTRFNLLEKIQRSDLNDEDKEVTLYLLSSIRKSRESVNYLFIFVLSFIAVLADVALTLMGR